MKIIKAFPPNFNTLAKTFPIKGRPGILYAFGDRIYNPSGIRVEPWMVAHEGVHGERQGDSPHGWWAKYVIDPAFRLEEEVIAHRMEWAIYKDTMLGGGDMQSYLYRMAHRLSSPLYGSLLTLEQARRRIEGWNE